MFFKTVLAVLCCSVAIANASNYKSCGDFIVYQIEPKNVFEQKVLFHLLKNGAYVPLPTLLGNTVLVMVHSEQQNSFENALNKFGLDYTVINKNVDKSVKTELRTARVSFSKYMRLNEINAYLDQLASDYPSRVQVNIAGKSYEGRDMKTITISNGDGRADKKVILVDAGIHAREWITPAGVLYIIQQLVENYAENAHLLDTYDWVILPVVNPDGYEYTHEVERMWRKTRKPVTNEWIGTDANRNFDFHWGEEGASKDPRHETFMGVQPFSEPETQVLRDLMLSLTGRASMYLTLHSYAKAFLYPWGYTKDKPDTWRDIDAVAQAGADAIQATTGVKYRVGSSTEKLGAAAGGSDDYALSVAKIPISITVEMRGGIGGNPFDPPAEEIKPIVKETWIGVKAMAEKVIQTY